MNLKAFRCGANVIAFEKNHKRYGMTCAWAMMVDYSKIMMLIGSQSQTGNQLEIGDLVGVSALACGQEDIARKFGTVHSLEVDKFKKTDFSLIDNMIIINHAKVQMQCKVVEIKDLSGDKLVTLEVLNFIEEDDIDYLDGYNPLCYHK